MIYKVKPIVPYSGGCAIVVANSANQAIKLVNDKYPEYVKGYVDMIAMRIVSLQSEDGTPRIITNEIYVEDL